LPYSVYRCCGKYCPDLGKSRIYTAQVPEFLPDLNREGDY